MIHPYLRWLLLVLICPLALGAQQPQIVLNNQSPYTISLTRINPFLRGSFPYMVKNEPQEIPLFIAKPTFVTVRFEQKGMSGRRHYLVYPEERIFATEGKYSTPIFKTDNPVRNAEFKFLDDLYEEVPDLDFFKFKSLPKDISLSARDAYIKSIYRRAQAFIDREKKADFLSPEFVHYLQTFLKCSQIINQLETQIHRYQYADQITGYYRASLISAAADFNHSDCENIFEYKKAAVLINDALTGQSTQQKLRSAEDLFPESSINSFLSNKYLYDELLVQKNTVAPHLIRAISQQADSYYSQKVRELLKLKTNDLSIDNAETVLLREDGSKILFSQLLKDLRGKIVYLDFWATWCGPCKAEMPASAALRDAFKNNNVIFLFLSADEDFDVWRTEFPKLKIPKSGSYLMQSASDNALVKELQVKSYPRYVLLDTKGKIVMSDAPRPSDPKITSAILSLIKQQR